MAWLMEHAAMVDWTGLNGHTGEQWDWGQATPFHPGARPWMAVAPV